MAAARQYAWLRRNVAHPVEAAAAALVYVGFRVLPLDLASAIGGRLARLIGPRLGLSARARRNLRRAFPDLPGPEVERLVAGMWDNLGRLVAEFAHLTAIRVYDSPDRFEVVGAEHVDALRDDGKPGIFFSGHLANWEIVSLAATQRGLPLDRVYRAANNRLVEWLYRRGRAAVAGALIPKGAAGARLLLRSLGRGNHVGMLVDQKMNDGIAVPFFGRDAMTSTALAEFALRFRCPVVPARVVRLRGARFRIEIRPPLDLPSSGDRHADVHSLMTAVNRVLEGWIRERPEQWLWLHNRWPD